MSSAIELIVEGYARLVGRANLQLHEVVALSRRSAFSKEARTRLRDVLVAFEGRFERESESESRSRRTVSLDSAAKAKLVSVHNHDDSDLKTEIRVGKI